MRGLGIMLALLFVAACGSVKSDQPPDANVNPPGPDASVTPGDGGTGPARSAREVVSGGGRVSGGGMTMDVQIGHGVTQGATSGGGQTLEGGAAIKP